jgi:hypothetical protein
MANNNEGGKNECYFGVISSKTAKVNLPLVCHKIIFFSEKAKVITYCDTKTETEQESAFN